MKTAESIQRTVDGEMIVGVAGKEHMSVPNGFTTYKFANSFKLSELAVHARLSLSEITVLLECGDEVHPDLPKEMEAAFVENVCIGAATFDKLGGLAENRIAFHKRAFFNNPDFLKLIPSKYIIVHIPKALVRCKKYLL